MNLLGAASLVTAACRGEPWRPRGVEGRVSCCALVEMSSAAAVGLVGHGSRCLRWWVREEAMRCGGGGGAGRAWGPGGSDGECARRLCGAAARPKQGCVDLHHVTQRWQELSRLCEATLSFVDGVAARRQHVCGVTAMWMARRLRVRGAWRCSSRAWVARRLFADGTVAMSNGGAMAVFRWRGGAVAARAVATRVYDGGLVA